MNTHSSDYKPFARKYRPQNLKDLIGQEVLVQIINNALLQNKIAHAYLLTGIRGIGKTTTARIIARLLNCTNRFNDNGYMKNCESCVNCQNFKSHPDIIEIDAASNTSVEDAKIIIEQAEYRPILGIYKVFIIDEVHMLSKSAFNALLKCIEEPNDNVVFIFATTEIHKVPLTIVSRCQRFDLKRFKITDLINLINKVCEQENVEREEAAIKIIAQKAGGSARDCLSILEQVALSSSNKITKENVENVLGLISTADIISLVRNILTKDLNSVIALIDRLWEVNVDFVSLAEDIIDLLSNIAKFKLTKSHLDLIYEDYQEMIAKLATDFDMHYLTIVWQIFSKSLSELKYGHDQKMHLEMMFIKAMHASTLPSIDSVLKQAIMHNTASIKIPHDIKTIQQQSQKSIAPPFQRIPITPTHSQSSIKQDANLEEALIAILESLYKKYEFDLYYYLINESEITKIENNTLYLSSNSLEPETKDKLLKSLQNLNNTVWSINFNKTDQFFSLKEKMKDEFLKSKAMEIIKSQFPQSKLVDILFKNT